ncbi:MAG: DUF2070 family protein [Candidatus Micrarchaeota archaeon]
MDADQREKAVGLTRFIFSLPSYRKILVYLLAFSFLAGVLLRILFKGGLSEALVYGGTEGFLFFAFPALLAALLSTSIIAFHSFKHDFKYFLFVALIAAVITSAGLFFDLLVGGRLFAFKEYLLIANGLVVLVWFAAAFVPLNAGWKALPVSFIQAFFNIAFLYLWNRFGVLESTVYIGSPVVAFFKIIVSGGILLLALWSLFYVINAPGKRNFGISTIQAVALFFAQWTVGSKEFEEVLAEMGEKVETDVGFALFKNEKGRNKAVFIVPGVHFGPFGNLGGSEYPVLIARDIGKKTGAMVFVFHALVNHDFNPVSSGKHGVLSGVVLDNLRLKTSSKAFYVEGSEGDAHVFGLGTGNSVFLTLSRAPKSTEDIDRALGVALANKTEAQGFKTAVLSDRHNSVTDGFMMHVGSKAFSDFEGAISSLKKGKESALSLGVASDDLKEYSLAQGVGRNGLRVAVFEVNGRKACFALFDGNNVLPEFRRKAVKELTEMGFNFADVCSTDAHSVNSISGVHNPIGAHHGDGDLLVRLKETAKRALNDLQPVSVAIEKKRVELDIMGTRKQSELISTVNSIVSIIKILAPVIFVLSLLLVVLFLLFLR